MSEAKVANKFNFKKFFKENNAIIIFVLLIIIACHPIFFPRETL